MICQVTKNWIIGAFEGAFESAHLWRRFWECWHYPDNINRICKIINSSLIKNKMSLVVSWPPIATDGDVTWRFHVKCWFFWWMNECIWWRHDPPFCTNFARFFLFVIFLHMKTQFKQFKPLKVQHIFILQMIREIACFASSLHNTEVKIELPLLQVSYFYTVLHLIYRNHWCCTKQYFFIWKLLISLGL